MVAAARLTADPRLWLAKTRPLLDRPPRPIGATWLSPHTASEVRTLRHNPKGPDETQEDVGRAKAAGAVAQIPRRAVHTLPADKTIVLQVPRTRLLDRLLATCSTAPVAAVDAAQILVDLIASMVGEAHTTVGREVKVDQEVQRLLAIADDSVVLGLPELRDPFRPFLHPEER